jgi:hypothetical protein
MNGNLNLINTQVTARNLSREAESWRRAHRAGGEDGDGWGAQRPPRSVRIRGAGDQDEAALVRLAQLEGQPRPRRFRILVAEVDGEVLAALPLGGEAIADPFRHTASLVEMLKLRAAELEDTGPERRRGLRALLAQMRAPRRRPQPSRT